jgi:hypothetical protein
MHHFQSYLKVIGIQKLAGGNSVCAEKILSKTGAELSALAEFSAAT